MKISNSYPYPVLQLNNDDYSDSRFQVEYKTHEAFGEFKIHATFKLENQGIEHLIHSQAAIFMLHVQCPQTSYRKIFTTTFPELNESIETNRLRGKVEIHSYIIAQCEIPHYTNRLLNDWYRSMEIRFEKGNFLAIGNAIEVILHEDNTELMNLPSIIDIRRSINQEYMEVDIFTQNITVSLPALEFELYGSYAKNMMKSTIISMVILPSLTYVFSKIQEVPKSELEVLTWYQVMEKIFKENSYQIEDVGTDRLTSLKAAQLVLRKPLKTSFIEIDDNSKSRDDI